MAETVAKAKTKTRKKVEAMPITQEQLETIAAPMQKTDAIDRLVEDSKPKDNRTPLDMRMPFATRKQQLTYLARTGDGQLVFQGQTTGTVITTDSYGIRIGGPQSGKQLVFNGTPEDLRKTRTRTKFVIGEVIYTIRPMSKHRKVYAGVVQSFDPKGVVLIVLGAIGKAAFNQARTLNDGHVIAPYNLCFKTQEQLEMFVHKFQDDLARSQTDFRQLKEHHANAAMAH